MTYAEAVTFGRSQLHAELLALNISQYFHLDPTLGLQTGPHWIGGTVIFTCFLVSIQLFHSSSRYVIWGQLFPSHMWNNCLLTDKWRQFERGKQSKLLTGQQFQNCKNTKLHLYKVSDNNRCCFSQCLEQYFAKNFFNRAPHGHKHGKKINVLKSLNICLIKHIR